MSRESAKPGVLVVEDDLDQAEIIQRLLEPEFDVFLAYNTEEAEALMARRADLQILLCDQQMPGELGLDYCRRLQKRTSPLVRILMTGYVEQDFLLEAINSQALFHYLVKPFSRDDLFEVLWRAQAYYSDRRTQANEQVALEALKVQQGGFLHRIGRAGQMIFGVGSMILVTILIIIIVSAGIGLLLLLLLYLLKSFLGIDVFKDSHLSDWF